MSDRIFNFSAGPAILPEEVIKQAQQDIWNIDGSGIGIMEHSHRGKVFDRVLAEAVDDCRAVGSISDDFEILFLQGGASTQFFQIPANFLAEDRTADYLDTGVWARKAVAEAKHYGEVNVAFSGAESNYSRLPRSADIKYSAKPVYVHMASNNTIYGTQYQAAPQIPAGAFLACDASSDIFSRPVDVSQYGMIYAGAQKNLGPSGVALVIVRKDLIAEPVRELPSMLRYNLHAEKGSRYNTPPATGIYVMGQVFKWILRQGGLPAMQKSNDAKAAVLYDAIDASSFYTGVTDKEDRSKMNVTFRLPSEDLEAQFISEALPQGMSGLKGHRSAGGIRASIYNAFPKAGCEALTSFMRDFEAKNG